MPEIVQLDAYRRKPVIPSSRRRETGLQTIRMYSYSLQNGLVLAKRLPRETVLWLVHSEEDIYTSRVLRNNLIDELMIYTGSLTAPAYDLNSKHLEYLASTGLVKLTLFQGKASLAEISDIPALDVLFLHWKCTSGVIHIHVKVLVSDNDPESIRDGFLSKSAFIGHIGKFVDAKASTDPEMFSHISFPDENSVLYNP